MGKKDEKLKAIPGHKNYYRKFTNGIPGVIVYKDASIPKFSTRETNITKAKRAVDIRRQQLFEGKTLSTAKRDVMKVTNPLISELWAEMLEEKKQEVTPGTLGTWDRSYRMAFGEFYKQKHIQDINIRSITLFKSWYLQHRGTKHSKKMLVHFKYFLKWCVKHKVMREMPDLEALANLHEVVEKRAARVPVGRVYDEKTEIIPMLQQAQKISNTAYLGILLAVRCGMRKMEIMQLQWYNIDLKKMKIKVWSSKNGKWREVPIVPDIQAALWTQKTNQLDKTPWVFPMKSLPSAHQSGQLFDKYWVDVKAAAEIKGRARFHDLRHTFATRTAEDGWPPVIAYKVLDMSPDIYNKVYCKPSSQSIADVFEKTYEKTTNNEGEKP
jgi:integrase